MFLTDREFWLNYWESHREEILVKVPEKNMLAPVFEFMSGSIETNGTGGGFFRKFYSDFLFRTSCELDNSLGAGRGAMG